MAGLVVIGNGQAARAVSLAGTSMQLPVLWAKGGVANLHGTSGEVSTFLDVNFHSIRVEERSRNCTVYPKLRVFPSSQTYSSHYVCHPDLEHICFYLNRM